jgi:hypothetical protein
MASVQPQKTENTEYGPILGFDPVDSRWAETGDQELDESLGGLGEQAEPRETMRVLPAIVQGPLSLLCGIPLAGQQPRWKRRPWHYVAGPICCLAAGFTLSAAGLSAGGALMVVAVAAGWALTLHGARVLRQVAVHQASHQRFFGLPRLDQFIGRAATALLIMQDFSVYRTSHIRTHHGKGHMTAADPTTWALAAAGLFPGMSTRSLRRRLLLSLVSPRYHAQVLASRLRAWLLGPRSLLGRLLVAAVIAAWITLGWLVGWTAILVGWVLPITIFYQAAELLRLAVEHDFPKPGQGKTGATHPAELSFAIFLGDPAPSPMLRGATKAKAWARWAVRLVGVHLPTRYLVLVGDTCVHDLHHRRPKTMEWPNYVYARDADARSPRPGSPPSRAVWTYRAALELVFNSMASCDPVDYSELWNKAGRTAADGA